MIDLPTVRQRPEATGLVDLPWIPGMGHACINVQNSFWKEPVILWIAVF